MFCNVIQMTGSLTSFSTVFHSYPDNKWVIMIGSVNDKLNRFGNEKICVRYVINCFAKLSQF